MLGSHAGGIVVQDAGSWNFASEVRVDLRDWSLSPPSEIAKTGNSPYKKNLDEQLHEDVHEYNSEES